ncbi:hypothetical protein FD14_GL000098 [Secundilactobacillus similis DSM 23365 = JCM 2765]|uniref:Integral membrane protein n=1 Tax=Secundilactobacillus similis DSM 23365 = JCM 2765 TaxID=1423804 RepID=A0A0R2FC55_9LACO|nr:hypothetical protein FD14_GL000098 [Secundilactobacillus similis DSM 23365 = JCM 2765]
MVVVVAILKRFGWPYWAVGLVMGLFVPILLQQVTIDPVWHSGVIFGLVNSVLAGVIGYLVKHRGEAGWLILVLPVIFAVGIWVSGPAYAIYFAISYLCISYLAYGLTR